MDEIDTLFLRQKENSSEFARDMARLLYAHSRGSRLGGGRDLPADNEKLGGKQSRKKKHVGTQNTQISRSGLDGPGPLVLSYVISLILAT